MKKIILILMAVVIANLIVSPNIAFAEDVTFKFNPPDSITFIQNLKTTTTTDMGSASRRNEVTESTIKITLFKTIDGYRVIAAPESVKTTLNAQPIENPILSLLQSAVVTYNLNKNGQVLSVSGYEKLIDMMKGSFPQQLWASVSSYLDPATLSNKDAAEWNGRIGSFVGQTVKIGEAWPVVKDSFAIPSSGTVYFYSTTKVAEKSKCGNIDCVKVMFQYNSDGKALFDFIGNTSNELARALGDSTSKMVLSGGKIAGSGERLIDPKTMLIYSETLERTITTKNTAAGQGDTPITQTEKREYSFDYGK
jgi:hypothetical protein